MNRIWFKNPFRLRWIAIIVMTSIIPFVSVSLWSVNQATTKVMEEKARTAITIQSMIKVFFAEDFSYSDYPSIGHKVRFLREQMGLAYVLASLPNGETIVSDGEVPASLDSKSDDGNIRMTVAIGAGDGITLGNISFGISLREYVIQRRIVLVGLGISVAVFSFLQIVLLFAAIRKLLEPFNDIFASVRGLSQGRYEKLDKYLQYDDERRDLSESYNQVVAAFAEHERLQKESSRNAAIAQTTQMLAHDVRKPFTMLKMMMGLLTRTKTIAEVHALTDSCLPELESSLSDVNGLIQDVMEIGSTSIVLNVESVTPESLLEVTIQGIFRVIENSSVVFEYNLQHTKCVLVDTYKVRRVFSNILGNAVQAMQQSGIVRIATSNIEENGQNYVKFVLGNNGPPISAEHLSKLFDAFFTSGKKGGTGLGLAIAHKIVTAHGGKIWCESSPGIGVEFHLTLPASEKNLVPDVSALPQNSREIIARFQAFGTASPDDDTEVRLEIALKNLLPNLGRRMSVLIVDDENIYRNSLSESLTRHQELAALLEVSLAEHSDGALALPSPDLAIIDVDLGSHSLSGFELVSEMRRRGEAGFICIHSNRISASDNKTAITQGADAFLPKPMSRAHLLKLLCQALERLGLVDPTLSSSNAGIAGAKAAEKLPETSLGNDEALVSVLVDDMKSVRMIWQADWPVGKLVTFVCPEKFWAHVDANPGFLESLSCIVTDMNFGEHSSIDGEEFARQIKLRTRTPVLVASNSELRIEDFNGSVDGILEKDPPNRQTLERYLKRQS
jgi:signal transduction histidine kinase/DNA-binding NarL/FixJ family response regulator